MSAELLIEGEVFKYGVSKHYARVVCVAMGKTVWEVCGDRKETHEDAVNDIKNLINDHIRITTKKSTTIKRTVAYIGDNKWAIYTDNDRWYSVTMSDCSIKSIIDHIEKLSDGAKVIRLDSLTTSVYRLILKK